MAKKNFDEIGIQVNPFGKSVNDTFTRSEFYNIIKNLMRIGIESHRDGFHTLYQSCHILRNEDRYKIVHFKEMFQLDGKHAEISKDDYDRRDKIAVLLEDWKLLNISDKHFTIEDGYVTMKIVPFRELNDWKLVSKYKNMNRNKNVN